MKIQKLTIHNIASIVDAVIDFEASPLAESEVFLITGDTGSGKSTILDAICLALYANTPRLRNTEMEGDVVYGEFLYFHGGFSVLVICARPLVPASGFR